MENKKCSQCGEVKPLEEFAKDARRKHGRAAKCRICRAKNYAFWRHRPDVRQSYLERDRKRQNKVREQRRMNGLDNYNPQPGHVYIIQCERFFKIGKSVDADRRLKEISAFLPFRVEMIHKIETDDFSRAELKIHQHFSNKRATGEWFELDRDDIQWLLAISEMIFWK